MTEQTGQQPGQQQPSTQQQQHSEVQPQRQTESSSDPHSQQQHTTPSSSSSSPRSSADLEAENRALRAIISGHVEGINIDEELEYVGPSGKYRPAHQPAQNQPQEHVQEQRTSRRQGLSNPRAEAEPTVDIAAIDREFDNFLSETYGFDMGGGDDA